MEAAARATEAKVADNRRAELSAEEGAPPPREAEAVVNELEQRRKQALLEAGWAAAKRAEVGTRCLCARPGVGWFVRLLPPPSTPRQGEQGEKIPGYCFSAFGFRFSAGDTDIRAFSKINSGVFHLVGMLAFSIVGIRALNLKLDLSVRSGSRKRSDAKKNGSR